MDSLQTFLQLLNNQHINNKFTLEIEINACLPFLDVKVESNNKIFVLSHGVYLQEKNTHRHVSPR